MESTESLRKRMVENPTKEKEGFEITRLDLFNLQVCSKLPVNKIQEVVNRYSPSGTENGWILETKGENSPVECNNKDGSKHYMFSC